MAGIAVGAATAPDPPPRGFWVVCAVCAALPDIDALGRPFGRGDVAFLGGHRALTHSLPFALVLGLLLAWIAFPTVRRSRKWPRLWIALALAAASHGMLDALTAFGDGIELLAPFSSKRFRAPWQPLGSTFARDFAAFLLLAAIARIVLWLRGMVPPGFLTGRFRRLSRRGHGQ